MIHFFWILIYPLFLNSLKPEGKVFQTMLWLLLLLSWNVKAFPWLPTLLIIWIITFSLHIIVVLTFPFPFRLIGLSTVSLKTLITEYFLTSWNHRYSSLPKKALWILLLSDWILLPLLQTLHRIIRNPFCQTNLSPDISQKQIPTVNLVCILRPIKPARKSLNSTAHNRMYLSCW